jgi:acetoin utilization deacetylase AcuC-like enzyme
MASFPAQQPGRLRKKQTVSRRLFYTDQHALALPDGHKFPAGKYTMLRNLLESEGQFTFEPAPFADASTIALAHDAIYVEQFLEVRLPPAAMRRIGLPWSEAMVRRALASVGGTLSAARDALEYGWGGTLSGGTHHAFHAAGAGFCVFNDVAVAIQSLRKEGLVRRVAVVDLDVHQGDGTAEIFADDQDVFTLSLHGQSNFPFRKQVSSLDVGLPDKTEDAEYLRQLDLALPKALASQPDIIFYQAGVDPLYADVLGRLSLSFEGLKERDRRAMQVARDLDIPLVLTAGGGYSRPVELSVQAHANTYRTAAKVFLEHNLINPGSQDAP